MAKPINLYQAKTHLSELVDRAAAGEEIVIAKAGRPMARLVPFQPPVPERRPGRLKGKIRVAPGWDAPMTDEQLKEWHEAPIEPTEE